MITDTEREALSELRSSDFYSELLLLTFSRYDRLSREATLNNLILGPADFVALIDEAYNDLEVSEE
jgi:hypothetical protein